MTILFGPDAVESAVRVVLDHLATGTTPASGRWESRHVDLKEEAGTHDGRGARLHPPPQNETAAQQLAGEAACMANTPEGGAVIVGATDSGQLRGTGLDAEWLRARIYDLTQRLLTVDVREVVLHGVRLLVVRSPQALEPIRWKGKITWRVDDRCVEIDAATWHARRMTQHRYDWSDDESRTDPRQARPQALAYARESLLASGEAPARDLAGAPDGDFLRRLNVVTADGYLTNAGVLAFVGRPEPSLDYIRRDVAGGDSTARVRQGGRSLLEEIAEIERVVAAHNDLRQVRRGLVIGRVRDLPELAVREAIVNGVVHRDWAGAAPTVVEHIGRSLVVTSPGGFVGGVTPDNIITHPSQARNRALAELFSALRLAEREGIGVDRMVRDMLSVGYPAPDIRELPGPFVRTALVGEPLDVAWIGFLTRLEPADTWADLRQLMLLRHLVAHGWVDVGRAAPLLQLTPLEAAAAVTGLGGVRVGRSGVIDSVAGVPDTSAPAWRLSTAARQALAEEDALAGSPRAAPSRAAIALEWARHRGRVSSTELASIVGAAPPNVGPVLRTLEDEGRLRPSRANRRGPGFHYLPVDPVPPTTPDID